MSEPPCYCCDAKKQHTGECDDYTLPNKDFFLTAIAARVRLCDECADAVANALWLVIDGRKSKRRGRWVGPVRQCDDPDAYWDDVVEHDGDWRTCTRCKKK